VSLRVWREREEGCEGEGERDLRMSRGGGGEEEEEEEEEE
jgi:hypothetical protein